MMLLQEIDQFFDTHMGDGTQNTEKQTDVEVEIVILINRMLKKSCPSPPYSA